MNLWLRLIWLLVTARWRGTIALPDGYSAIRFRVWPHDLDPSIHMNNGRYLTLMGSRRLDVMLRSAYGEWCRANGWTPIASTVAIYSRRELRPFQKFRLETRLFCWDETFVEMEQIFCCRTIRAPWPIRGPFCSRVGCMTAARAVSCPFHR